MEKTTNQDYRGGGSFRLGSGPIHQDGLPHTGLGQQTPPTPAIPGPFSNNKRHPHPHQPAIPLERQLSPSPEPNQWVLGTEANRSLVERLEKARQVQTKGQQARDVALHVSWGGPLPCLLGKGLPRSHSVQQH